VGAGSDTGVSLSADTGVDDRSVHVGTTGAGSGADVSTMSRGAKRPSRLLRRTGAVPDVVSASSTIRPADTRDVTSVSMVAPALSGADRSPFGAPSSGRVFHVTVRSLHPAGTRESVRTVKPSDAVSTRTRSTA